ncbi:MAG TPA: hypothetical protein VFU97_25525 [Xanthobacteraceae bacterium]|nr:hypothetical protein [Xanthobacteraceae bacterium]
MNGRKLLFNEREQKLLELNDVGAFIWCRLEDGLDRQGIIAELVAGGLDRKTAELFFRKSADDLARLGAIRDPNGTSRTISRRAAAGWRQVIEIAGVPIELRGQAADIRRSVRSLFGHLQSSSAAPVVRLVVEQSASGIDVRCANLSAVVQAPDQVMPTIKAQLTETVLQLARYQLALHAAVLERKGRAVLIVGPPGAGKTTLCLALVAAGMTFAGDDIVLLRAGGLAQGVPFPAAVKSGSWKFERCFARTLDKAPIHRRGDGQEVKYLRPRAVASGSYPIRAVILLDRRNQAAEPSLDPLHPVDALRAIIAGAFTPSQALDGAGFSSLVDGLTGADCYMLSYGDPKTAAAAIGAACP